MAKEEITGGKVSTNYTFVHPNGNTYNLFIYENIETPLGIIPMRIVIKKLQNGDIEMDIFQGDVYDRIIDMIQLAKKMCETKLPHFPYSYSGGESSQNNLFALGRNWLQTATVDGANIFSHFHRQLSKSEAKLYNWAFEKIDELTLKERSDEQ